MSRSSEPLVPRKALTPDEFAAHFQRGARALWLLAAGVLGDATEAEDVLQEAFLAALHKLREFDPETNFLAWMGRFVRNIALNEKRKRLRRQTDSTDPVWLDGADAPAFPRAVAPAPSPVDGRGVLRRDQGDFDDRVLAGLVELSEAARACLLLRVVADLGYGEIAALLDIPEGTAMSHVHRARTALRERLGAPVPTPLGILEGEARS